jgi:hypothetical protein
MRRGLEARIRANLQQVTRLTEEALRALNRARTPESVGAALEALPIDDGRVRRVLLEKYAALAPEPSRRDPGCHLRVALLKGLRGRAVAGDAPLLEAALWTYEFIRPEEVAGGLRATALLVLREVDDRLASFHAVRLLGDRQTSRMSGEPAATAARLLAAQGEVLPLYQRLTVPDSQSEVAAECLRGLREAPQSVLGRLADELGPSRDGLVLIALIDVLLGHAEAERLAPALMGLVEECPDLDVVRYAATAIVAERRIAAIEELRARAGLDGQRGELVREALSLLPG